MEILCSGRIISCFVRCSVEMRPLLRLSELRSQARFKMKFSPKDDSMVAFKRSLC